MSVSNTADRRGDRRAETVPLVAEQEQRTSADGRARIQLHFPSSDLSVNVQNSPLQPEQRVRSPTHRRCLCGSQSGLMSGSVLYPWPCGRISLVCGLLLLASSPLLTAGRMGNCSHPLVPEHGGFRCDPSPCRGFLHKSTIHLFCEPGYHIRSKYRVSKCRHGMWQPAIPTCVHIKEGPNMNSDDRVNDSMPSMATTAVGVSIFLLTTTACLVVKVPPLPLSITQPSLLRPAGPDGGRPSCPPPLLRGGGVRQLGAAHPSLLRSRTHPAPLGSGVPQLSPVTSI
ncbi:Sushi domain-containing protein 4 [Larimichthys crocea]|uniref:Uncharacterized protein n=1 Tax=Larimichthys crocea TaxID=215358 RepID=A0ACD3QKP8_LARCR|nr:Sushi domain-containing protein 4 [Larimichthys crocea]